jgi:hypothetical protein
MSTPKPRKPTGPERRALENLAAGRDSDHGLVGRSAHGGHCKVRGSLWRKGWRDANGITEAGRIALAQATAPKAPPAKCPTGYTLAAHENRDCNCVSRGL